MASTHTVCRVGEIADGHSLVVEIAGKPIAVFREGDRYFAIHDTCPHMGASLSEGYLEDGIVTCSWHAWRFRLADGAWADNPRLKIGCYPVQVVGDEVRIEMAEPTEQGQPS